MFLGPAVPATCKACRRKVGVPYSSVWTVLPFLVAMILALFADSILMAGVLWGLGFAAMSLCHLNFVPLIKR